MNSRPPAGHHQNRIPTAGLRALRSAGIFYSCHQIRGKPLVVRQAVRGAAAPESCRRDRRLIHGTDGWSIEPPQSPADANERARTVNKMPRKYRQPPAAIPRPQWRRGCPPAWICQYNEPRTPACAHHSKLRPLCPPLLRPRSHDTRHNNGYKWLSLRQPRRPTE